MRGGTISRIVPALLGALCILALLVVGARAQGVAADTVVRIDPVEQDVSVGQEVTIDVYVADVSDLYGADVRLSFDPTLLQVVDAAPLTPGVQVTLGPLLTQYSFFYIRNEADNTAGTVWVALTQLNPAPPVGGSGVFMSVTLCGVAEGASTLHFSGMDLVDRNGSAIAAATQDGTITVRPASGLQYSIWLPVIVESL